MAGVRWRRGHGIRRRALSALVLGLAASVAAPVAASGYSTLAGDPWRIEVSRTGAMQATANGQRFFQPGSPGVSGFAVRIEDGPLADQAFASTVYRMRPFTPVSESAVTRIGDLHSVETEYAVREADVGPEQLRIRQVTRYRDSDHSLRVTYRVQNMGTVPVRFRAAALADLAVDGETSGTGAYASRPVRFVGALNRSTGVAGGLEEVRESLLPGDAAPVPLPAWSAYQAGLFYEILAAPGRPAGFDGSVTADTYNDVGAGVQWSDQLHGAGLPPGAEARYEVVWRLRRHPPLFLPPTSTYRYVGAEHVATAVVADESGALAPDRAVRWHVTGANPSAEERETRTDASGKATFAYVGEATGSDSITAYVDEDGDGQRDAAEPVMGASVRWAEPPPPLFLNQGWGDPQVGTPVHVWGVLRSRIGEPMPGAAVRWSVTGANPSAERLARTDTWSEFRMELTARRAGTDTLMVHGDYDDDGVRDAGEPVERLEVTWAPPPPPLVVSSSPHQPEAGSDLLLAAVLRDEFGERLVGRVLRWSIEGVTAGAAGSATTDGLGVGEFRYTAPRSGEDQITVFADLDEDGVRGPAEPQVSVTQSWRQAPPPPVTRATIAGNPLTVSVTSVGELQATSAAAPGDSPHEFLDPYYQGFFLRFSGGPLDGRTFGPRDIDGEERYYGEPLPPPVTDGDTRSQTATYTVRSGDIDYVRVHQTVRYTDGDSRFRVTYRVEGLTDSPMRFQAAAAARLRSWGVPVSLEAPRRFVGGMNSWTGEVGGLAEVRESQLPGEPVPVPVAPWASAAADDFWALTRSIRGGHPLRSAEARETWLAVGLQWDDRLTEPLGPGLDAAARYELLWRVREPAPLRLTPPSTLLETGATHHVTATAISPDEERRNGVTLRWSVAGANPSEDEGTLRTSGLGQATISWTGRRPGRDTLTVYEDHDGDSMRGADEPLRTATVDWRPETAVDPPRLDPVVAADGTRFTIGLQVQGDRRFFGVPPEARSHFPRCADGSLRMNLGMAIDVNPGAGRVVEGSMELLTVNTSTNDLEHPVDRIPPSGSPDGQTYRFVIECVRQTAVYLCYELVEEGLPVERFCVLVGGLGLYDPSGVVYDRVAYDAHVAAGRSGEQALAASAIRGAEVRLQRRYEGAFRQVLSGDPFVSPNLNPLETDRFGRFAWAVSAGTYRVVVTREGYEPRTSREVTVPPPELALHVALEPVGGVSPLPDPEPLPEPEPEPTPTPTAEPDPTPTPTPTAEPEPDPTPTPTPEPDPTPTPTAEPDPTPTPTAEPGPEPSPEPEAEPEPVPPPAAEAWRMEQRYPPQAPPPPGLPAAHPPAAPPATAPTATLSRSRIVRGRLAVTVRCPRSAGSGCSGRYVVRSAGGRRLGVVRIRLAPGRSATYRVRLRPVARAALRSSAGRVQVRPLR